jgi:hypothetical protein
MFANITIEKYEDKNGQGWIVENTLYGLRTKVKTWEDAIDCMGSSLKYPRTAQSIQENKKGPVLIEVNW